MEAFIRRLLPKQVTHTPKSFRKKLLDDSDTGSLELAEFPADSSVATVPTYELCKFNRNINNSTSSTDQEHAAGATQATGFTGTLTTPSHSSSCETPCLKGQASTAVLPASACLEHSDGDRACVAGTSDELRHWQGCAANVRLVVGTLLQHASSEQCQQQLQQLLQSRSWIAACQQCKDALLLCNLLCHYFPHSVDLQQLAIVTGSNNSTQLPVHCSLAEICLEAAAAAGVPLPADCSPRSIAAAEPQKLLELLVAIIVAGELQQLLQDHCRVRLQAAAAQQQQQLLLQPHQQSQLQQRSEAVQPLLHAWLTSAAHIQCVMGFTDATKQHHGKGGANEPDTIHSCHYSWHWVVDLLLHLQQAQQQEQIDMTSDCDASEPKHDSSTPDAALDWHDPLTPFNDKPNSSAVRCDSSTNSNKLYNSSTGSRHSGTSGNGSNRKGQDIVQQLSQLGCNMPLLQPHDLQDTFLQRLATATAATAAGLDPLQLVLLVRLVRSTCRCWLPALQQQQNGTGSQLGLAAYVVPPLAQPQQRNTAAISCSAHDTTACDSGHSSEPVSTPADADLDSITQQVASDTQLSHTVSGGLTNPCTSWPPELLTTSQLWPGDEDEMDDAFTREERTLRCWINSLLHRSRAESSGAGSVGSRRSSGTGSGLDGSEVGAPQHPLDKASTAVPCGVGSRHKQICSWDELDTAVSVSGTATAGLVASTTAAVVQDAVEAAVTAPRTPTIGKRISRSSSDAGQQHQQSSRSSAASGSPCMFSFPSINSLFGAEIRSGVLLLELLEHLQPGCVDWKLANKLPFKMGAAAQLLALENCQLALKVAQDDFGLPLVSMAPRDVVLGRRKIILSLVYQLMRYHTMQLLESIASGQQQQPQSFNALLTAEMAGEGAAAAAAAAGSSPSVTPRAAAAAPGRVKIFSSSTKQRRQLAITEQDILHWANSKLQQVQPLCTPLDGEGTAVARPVIKSFKDPVLKSGLVLLQLLYVMDPEAVDLSFVTPGVTAAQRQSNARYALSVADKMGCSLFLVWEDLVDLQPRMVLVLLASLMYLDQTKQRQQQACNAATPLAAAAAAATW